MPTNPYEPPKGTEAKRSALWTIATVAVVVVGVAVVAYFAVVGTLIFFYRFDWLPGP